jgi:transposase-like protein
MTTDSTITPELLDQLLSNYSKPEDLTGENGLFKQLKKALIERALGAELTAHLGYEKGDPGGRGSGNSRNGTSSKTILTEDGEIEIGVPRDRAGSFEPQLIAKGQTRFDGFDDKILSLYARGMTVREIQGHLAELYGAEVSPDLISRVTDAVLEEVREWQSRPLDAVYPIVFFDAMRVKIRDEGLVKNKAVYVALAYNADGEKDVLGLWIEQTEGAKFWLRVVNELKARGVNDILIAVVDRLKGFPEAINSVYPQTLVQTCIVHLIRNSLAFVSWKDRKAILPSIKAIYRAESADAALNRLAEFEAEWGKRYPAIGQIWRNAWEHVVPFFAFALGIRKMIYTTNAVEALHRSLRKIIKTRGSFPTDEAALKLLYLAIRNAGVHWRRPVEWTSAMGQFAIHFGARFPGTAR